MSRATLPAVPVDAQPRVLSGRIGELPRAGIELGSPAASGWPRVVSFPRIVELGAALGQPLYPRLVLLEPAEPDGYLREWRPSGLAPERHLGYALQWFAFALTLAVVFVVANLRSAAPA
jgi:surfeit locus 1 family protein